MERGTAAGFRDGRTGAGSLTAVAVAVAVAATLLVPGVVPAHAQVAPQPVVELSVAPTGGREPISLSAGPDGAMWLALAGAAAPGQWRVARVRADGTMTALPLSFAPTDVTTGPDQQVWLTSPASNSVARVSRVGAVQTFPIPTPASWPAWITGGPDGATWFVEAGSGKLGRIDPATGALREVAVGGQLTGLVSGPDGHLWFSQRRTEPGVSAGRIGRMAPEGGAIRWFDVGVVLGEMVFGPDGNLWFPGERQIIRMTVTGTVTRFLFPPSIGQAARGLAVDGDGNSWFAVAGRPTIVRMTPRGQFLTFPVPSGSSDVGASLAMGADGNVWFTEGADGRVGWVRPPRGTFVDDDGNPHEPMIEAIARVRVTEGCTADRQFYCPGRPVTRGEAAAFLARALNLLTFGTDFFDDDDGSPHEADINRLAAAGISTGVRPRAFDPDALLTRSQLATFLARGFRLPPTTTDFFRDDNGNPHEDSINRIAAAAVTGGCTTLGDRYCPEGTLRRDHLAAFIGRSLD